jgi:hypothetical protein
VKSRLEGPDLRKILAETIRCLFHAMPLIPLAMKRFYLVLAAVLFVLIPYIKVKKLSNLLGTRPPGSPASREEQEIASALAKWRWLTFLKH